MTVREALIEPLRDPWLLIEAWNWKTACLSSLTRAGLFFAVNLTAGWPAALAAMQTELLYRALASGFYGGLTERLSRAQPARAAAVAAVIVLPGLAHSVEWLVHYAAGTAVLGGSVAGSIALSALSTRFNLFAMQRGVLTIDGRRPLLADIAALPGLLASFVTEACRGLHAAGARLAGAR